LFNINTLPVPNSGSNDWANAGETNAILATVVMMIAATFHLLIMVFPLGYEANKAGLPAACTVRDTRGDDHL
jgi:hypothetical protein